MERSPHPALPKSASLRRGVESSRANNRPSCHPCYVLAAGVSPLKFTIFTMVTVTTLWPPPPPPPLSPPPPPPPRPLAPPRFRSLGSLRARQHRRTKNGKEEDGLGRVEGAYAGNRETPFRFLSPRDAREH